MDVETLHTTWGKAAETFLWTMHQPDMDSYVPCHFPPRGLVLPMEIRPVANKINNATLSARNNLSRHYDNVRGYLSD
jgi:hypothetical protein